MSVARVRVAEVNEVQGRFSHRSIIGGNSTTLKRTVERVCPFMAESYVAGAGRGDGDAESDDEANAEDEGGRSRAGSAMAKRLGLGTGCRCSFHVRINQEIGARSLSRKSVIAITLSGESSEPTMVMAEEYDDDAASVVTASTTHSSALGGAARSLLRGAALNNARRVIKVTSLNTSALIPVPTHSQAWEGLRSRRRRG